VRTDIAFLVSLKNMTPLFAIRSTFHLKAASALLAATFLAAALPKTVQAYALEGPKWPNGSTPTIQLELGSANRTLSDGNTSWNSAVSPALDMWNRVMGQVQLGRVMNSTAPIVQGDRLNSLSFGSSFFGHSFGSNTLAVTSYSYSGSTMIEGDIVVNTAQPWDSYRGPLQSAFDIRRVVLHETGHLLGMDHSSVSTAIMNAFTNNSDSLQPDDIAGIQALYGAPTTSPTPTPTPTTTPTPTPSVTPSATPNPTPSATPTPTATPSVPPTPTPSATPTPTPSTVFVSVSVSPSSIQPGGAALFTIRVSTPPASDITVNYRMGGTAVFGTNDSLDGTFGQVTVPAGASSAAVRITELAAARRNKSASMLLTSGSGYIVKKPTTASVILSR